MIVGGRVGALFFIVCFLCVYRYKSSVFVSLLPHGRLNEWKELGKNGQRGFEYGEFWLARASFSPFLCSFLCRRVIAYLLSSSSKKKSTTTHGGKSIFWERIPAFHFLKRDLSTVGGVLYRLKSRVLSFFFRIAETCDNTTSLEHPFAMLSLSWHSALMRSIEETLIGEVRWFLIEIYHWKYHTCLSPYAYFSRRHY